MIFTGTLLASLLFGDVLSAGTLVGDMLLIANSFIGRTPVHINVIDTQTDGVNNGDHIRSPSDTGTQFTTPKEKQYPPHHDEALKLR